MSYQPSSPCRICLYVLENYVHESFVAKFSLTHAQAPKFKFHYLKYFTICNYKSQRSLFELIYQILLWKQDLGLNVLIMAFLYMEKPLARAHTHTHTHTHTLSLSLSTYIHKRNDIMILFHENDYQALNYIYCAFQVLSGMHASYATIIHFAYLI